MAEIIAVGSELLTPSRTDTNSLYLTDQLNRLGIEVTRKTIVGDSREGIAEALSRALQAADVVLVTGGLGPTNDDLTREAAADALSRPLLVDESSVRRLEELYRRFGVAMTDNNRRQAMAPQGAQVLVNGKGTAPGIFILEGGKLVFLLPGPPRELHPMVERQVVPLIRRHVRVAEQRLRQLRIASLPESGVDSRIEGLYRDYPNVETTILSSVGVIDVFFYWKGADDPRLANAQLDELTGKVRRELGTAVFADGPQALEEVVGNLLKEKGLRLAAAESCTGGWLGKMLTDVPGSSAYFLGGVVAYSNQLKLDLLHVSADSLKRFGAVSETVAGEMSSGVRLAAGVDLGLSITGVAGPEGGSPDKPVGTVCFGLSSAKGTSVKKRRLPGDRDAIRLRAARFALDWLRRTLI